jgi:hypothetical protein
LGGGKGALRFNLFGSQGSYRSISSVAPSLVVPNGGVGFIHSGRIRPFVTGLIPVVGEYWTSPVAERLARLRHEPPATADALRLETSGTSRSDQPLPDATSSSADRGDVAVAEIRRLQHEAAQEAYAELQSLLEEAQEAERAGLLGVARIRYHQAAARADGSLRRQLLGRIETLRDR